MQARAGFWVSQGWAFSFQALPPFTRGKKCEKITLATSKQKPGKAQAEQTADKAAAT